MPFVINMAWRETRAAWRHFMYFFICIALRRGSVGRRRRVCGEVSSVPSPEKLRALMGGDVEIRLSRPMSENGKSTLTALATQGIDTTHVSELVAMASRVDHAGRPLRSHPISSDPDCRAQGGRGRLSVLRRGAHDPGAPLHDLLAPHTQSCDSVQMSFTPTLSREGRGSITARRCYGAVVQESLLIKMGLAVGDPLKIGQAEFAITGVIRQEPDRAATAFSLGPRVMISQQGLAAADLIKPGSRIRERYLLRLPPAIDVQRLIEDLRGRLAGDSARVSSYREAQPQLRRFLDQLARYLGLIGLTALFVGGIGVASTVHAFLKEKLKTIAILKTVGADSGTIVRTYLFQALGLGFLGSLVGAALGFALQGLMPNLLAGFVPPDLLEFTAASRSAFSLLPMVKGLTLGVATTLLFTVWPLLGIRDIRPALVFRTRITPIASSENIGRRWWRMPTDPVRWLTAIAITAGLAALAIWQAGSVEHRPGVHRSLGGCGGHPLRSRRTSHGRAQASAQSAISRASSRHGKSTPAGKPGSQCDGVRRNRRHDHRDDLAPGAGAWSAKSVKAARWTPPHFSSSTYNRIRRTHFSD